MIKLCVLYCLGLGLSWLGLCSLMFALANWSSSGSLLPLTAGLLALALGGRFILATVRIYLRPKRRLRRDLNYPD